MLNKIKYKIDKQKEKRFWKKYNKKYVNPTQWQYVRSNDRNTVLSKNVKFSKDWNKTLRANHVCVFGGSLKEQEDSIILPNIQIGFNSYVILDPFGRIYGQKKAVLEQADYNILVRDLKKDDIELTNEDRKQYRMIGNAPSALFIFPSNDSAKNNQIGELISDIFDLLEEFDCDMKKCGRTHTEINFIIPQIEKIGMIPKLELMFSVMHLSDMQCIFTINDIAKYKENNMEVGISGFTASMAFCDLTVFLSGKETKTIIDNQKEDMKIVLKSCFQLFRKRKKKYPNLIKEVMDMAYKLKEDQCLVCIRLVKNIIDYKYKE